MKKLKRCSECNMEFKPKKSPVFCDKCYDILSEDIKSKSDIYNESIEDELMGRRFGY